MGHGDLGSEYILAGGDALVGDDLELVSDAHLTIREGRIASIGRGKPTAGVPIVDTSGKLLIPGLINCHTHIGDAILKERGYGYPAGTNLLWQPEGLRHGWMAEHSRQERIGAMRRAAEHMLRLGVVAFADFREGGIEGVKELREACDGLPIRDIIYARHAHAPMHTDDGFLGNEEGLAEEYRQEIEDALSVADGFSPVWANETTDAGLKETADIVRRHGKRLATHACETDLYRQLSLTRAGLADVERVVRFIAPDYVVHMTDASDAELSTIVESGAPIVLCARGQAALGNGFSPYARILGLGGRVGIGTDNLMVNSPDVLAELDFLSRVTRAVTHDTAVVDPRALVASATIEGARILGLDDELGSLVAGKEASIVVLDAQSPNLVDSVDLVASLVERASAADIQGVIVRGELVHGRV
ncbi:amidohydrolase family protein [Leifsonia bigeumensis]|uniref:Amidohydrolase family protein n=1 Tax=Leifsonella bigeumensis TaxID=433643 RepID=A0ABP7FB02_9MICO